jgi:putative ABC transport system permease protein
MRHTSRAAAILILAMTIAASTAASAVVNAAILNQLGVPDSDRLLNVEPLRNLPGRGAVVFYESYPNYLRLKDRRADIFAAVACVYQSVVGWDDRGDVRPLQVARVSASFFPAVAVPLLVGQPFTAADDGVTPAPVVVISHRVWMAAFAGDRHAIGQSLRLAGAPHTVVGVMPTGFALPATTDIWVPLGVPTFVPATGRVFSVLARLRPGVPVEAVDSLMTDLTTQAIKADSVMNRDFRYRVRPLREALVDNAGQSIWLVQAGALLLYLLAISNVWSLLMAWVVEHRHETAVRRALGASARDIVWLFVRRSLGLAVPAGVIGALGAWAALPFVRGLHPTPALGFLLSSAQLDARAVGVAVLLTLAAALAIGLVPAWHACRQDPVAGLGSASRGASLTRSASRWQRAMVLVQSALAVVVLFAAVVSGISFWRLAAVPDGFEAAGRLVVRAILPDARYSTHESRARFATRLLEEAVREQDLASVAFTTTLPVGDLLWGGRFFPEPPDGTIPRDPVTLHYRRISPGYLRTIGIPLLKGRDFDARDISGSVPVAIVSRAAAERLWNSDDPVGRRLRRLTAGANDPPLEVVGVAANTVDAGYAFPVGEAIYVPFAQASVGRLSIVARPRTDDAAAIAAVKRALKTADPTLAASDISSLSALVSNARAIPRLQMMLLTLFGIVAASLTALGSYGVMSQFVASRQRELAVRLAVGATPRRLGVMVLGQNARLAVTGISLGLVAAWSLGRALQPIVFGVSSTSAAALASVGVGTLLITLGATLVPAVRAALVNVTVGLRG